MKGGAELNAGASDAQLRELLEDTKALLSAAQKGDPDEIGRQLDKRKPCVDAVKAAGGAGSTRTETRKALIDEILLLDGKACKQIEELVQKCGEMVSDYEKKTMGLLKYNSSKYNLMSGQIIDKKD